MCLKHFIGGSGPDYLDQLPAQAKREEVAVI